MGLSSDRRRRTGRPCASDGCKLLVADSAAARYQMARATAARRRGMGSHIEARRKRRHGEKPRRAALDEDAEWRVGGRGRGGEGDERRRCGRCHRGSARLRRLERGRLDRGGNGRRRQWSPSLRRRRNFQCRGGLLQGRCGAPHTPCGADRCLRWRAVPMPPSHCPHRALRARSLRLKLRVRDRGGMSRHGGMSGMSGMSGMGGMSGMSGMSGMNRRALVVAVGRAALAAGRRWRQRRRRRERELRRLRW